MSIIVLPLGITETCAGVVEREFEFIPKLSQALVPQHIALRLDRITQACANPASISIAIDVPPSPGIKVGSMMPSPSQYSNAVDPSASPQHATEPLSSKAQANSFPTASAVAYLPVGIDTIEGE